MQTGLFIQPSHPPERAPIDTYAWDLEVIGWGDELGFEEVWTGEHFTAPWEPIPAPDLLIAQALAQTSRIKLAPGAHLLPFHHPSELAHRVMMLDHMAQGRLMLGVGAGSVPTDFALFGIDPSTGTQREMMAEAFQIMMKIWTEDGPWTVDGKFWKVTMPEPYLGFRPHLKPFQDPHPPIGVAGLSERSPSLKIAGARGFIPLSLTFNPMYLAGHWDAVEEGAAEAGRRPSRNEWRIVRDVFVAESDEEAIELATEGNQGRMWREENLRVAGEFGWLKYLKHDPSVPDADVTPEYLARNLWLIGSPDTVAERLRETYEVVGGFGTLLVNSYDYADKPGRWRRSMELLQDEVLPQLADLDPDRAGSAASA